MDSRAEKNTHLSGISDLIGSNSQEITFSHELKSHLNNINGFLELIQNTSLSNEQLEYLYNISTSFNKLIDTIEKKFNISKIKSIESYNIDPIPFSIELEAKSLTKSLEPLAKRCNTKINLAFDPNIPNFVVGIPMQLKVLLTDVLFQFIHFSKPSFIDLQFNIHKQTPSDLEIIVHIISNEIIKDQTLHKKIAKSILSDPTIKLYSIENTEYKHWSKDEFLGEECQFNQNDQFVIAFSFQCQKKPLDNSYNYNYKSYNVLIVEDDPINQKLMSNIMQKLDIQFDLCENGKEAVEICKTKKYDIIFMDFQMPIMDGLEATQRIRKEENLNNSSLIIGITAYSLEDLQTKSIYKGLDRTIEKPVRSSEIQDIIHNYNPSDKNSPSDTIHNSAICL